METRWPSQAPAVPSNAIECPVHPMLPQGLQAHLAVCCKLCESIEATRDNGAVRICKKSESTFHCIAEGSEE